jgi:hypothetical protein
LGGQLAPSGRKTKESNRAIKLVSSSNEVDMAFVNASQFEWHVAKHMEHLAIFDLLRSEQHSSAEADSRETTEIICDDALLARRPAYSDATYMVRHYNLVLITNEIGRRKVSNLKSRVYMGKVSWLLLSG